MVYSHSIWQGEGSTQDHPSLKGKDDAESEISIPLLHVLELKYLNICSSVMIDLYFCSQKSLFGQ